LGASSSIFIARVFTVPTTTRLRLRKKMIERLERSLARRKQVGDGTESDFHFTVWRLGEAFLVSTPAECYSQFQIDLRRKFPDTTVAVLNLSDGTTTYLPKPESFKRDVYQQALAELSRFVFRGGWRQGHLLRERPGEESADSAESTAPE